MTWNLSHLYSQNDPRWKDVVLGESTASDATIGNTGCLLVSFCNLHNALFGTDIQPNVLNTLFITNGVFVTVNGYALVVWANVPRALPMLKYVARDWNYSNPTVWAWITLLPRVPVIVECRLSAAHPSHFVVFLGGQKMVDALDGMVKPTSTYPTLTGDARYTRV